MRRRSCLHTLLQILILSALPLGVLQAQSDTPLNSNPYAWSVQTATQSGRVRVVITKHKPKLHLPKTQRPIVRLFADDRDNDYYSELLEFHVGYRRPELVNITGQVVDDELSDYVKLRLVLARIKALKRYHEKWG